ncbi:hypothetical protein BJ875DRAFT_372513, partial [Amylocarpus encephaloides]
SQSWFEPLMTEATTLGRIKKNGLSVLTEELIYDRIDSERNRTVIISKRVPGRTYQQAWPSLTTEQKLEVANQVAEHLKSLAEQSPEFVETVEGTALEGEHSLRVREGRPW